MLDLWTKLRPTTSEVTLLTFNENFPFCLRHNGEGETLTARSWKLYGSWVLVLNRWWQVTSEQVMPVVRELYKKSQASGFWARNSVFLKHELHIKVSSEIEVGRQVICSEAAEQQMDFPGDLQGRGEHRVNWQMTSTSCECWKTPITNSQLWATKM